jgi:transposase
LDESIFKIAPYITYGWFPVGSRPTIGYQHKRKEKHCVLGALNGNEFIYEFAETLNTIAFKKFVSRLICQFKKLVIVIDHAPYHVSKDMQRFYEDNKDCLHVEYFPSYSPELVPIELSWREVKKWLAIRCWRDKDELKEQLISAFQQEFVKVPMYEYLVP